MSADHHDLVAARAAFNLGANVPENAIPRVIPLQKRRAAHVIKRTLAKIRTLGKRRVMVEISRSDLDCKEIDIAP